MTAKFATVLIAGLIVGAAVTGLRHRRLPGQRQG